MVTGVETAGIALGLFPLVIEGIRFYISSAEKFREMKHHKRTLDKFRRELVMEKSKLDNTLYELVSRAGVPIAPHIELSPNIMEAALSRQPYYIVTSFVSSCQELITILSELSEKFQKYEQDRVSMNYILATLATNNWFRQAASRCLQYSDILQKRIVDIALSVYID